MKLTNEQRSMIASTFVGAFDHDLGNVECKRRSLCCAGDAMAAAARIVGKAKAGALVTFFYENLGCGGWRDKEYQDTQEQYFLDKIAALDEL